MLRAPLFLALRILPLTLLGVAAGCGGGGGLFATVPPPVEFAGTRSGGVEALPEAGTYNGTLLVEHVVYVYQRPSTEMPQGQWIVERQETVDPRSAATAEVAVDGTVSLLRAGADTPLFMGKLTFVPATPGVSASTTATLTMADGAPVLYPYFYRLAPTSLSVSPHGPVTKQNTYRVEFDRYQFDLERS